MMAKQFLAQLAKVSPARLFDVVSHPTQYFVRLLSPARLSSVEASFALFAGVERQTIEELRLEILRNHQFFQTVNDKSLEKRQRRISFTDWHAFLYVVTRLAEPEVVFETGVFDGLSSSVILQALADNGRGKLVSIDLPSTEIIPHTTDTNPFKKLPPDCDPGWLVPDNLKERYQLMLGDSKKLLGRLLEEHPKIDIFFHDSLHTVEHQLFEYRTAWPHLREGGRLLSDDIFGNRAFYSFVKEKKRAYVYVSYGLGAIRK